VAEVEASVKRVQRRERKPREGPLPPIEPGDRVFLHDVPTPGEAVTGPDSGGDFDVKLGDLRARINVRQVADVQKASPEVAARSEYAPVMMPPRLPPELDLRGMTVDEALSLVDQRLDEAVRSGVTEMRIIHGKGTGALRQAVREMLRRHALVSGQTPAEQRAGGDGVTVVELSV